MKSAVMLNGRRGRAGRSRQLYFHPIKETPDRNYRTLHAREQSIIRRHKLQTQIHELLSHRTLHALTPPPYTHTASKAASRVVLVLSPVPSSEGARPL
jgi:hypothetical protein